jgi:DNA-binding IclR family transcriptional regulator
MDGGFQAVKSADRTLDVLEALAGSPGRRSLGELTRTLGIPKSSLHGILRTMVRRGWVEADETGTRFRLGLRAVQVGASYVDGDDVVARFSGPLDGLAASFGETVHLGRLSGQDVTYLAKRESVHPLRLYSAIGRRLPAHATALGKALLATLTPDQRARYLRDYGMRAFTPATLTTADALEADLAAGERRGMQLEMGQFKQGVACAAVVVIADRDIERRLVLACSLPAAEMLTSARVVRAKLTAAARNVAEALSAGESATA